MNKRFALPLLCAVLLGQALAKPNFVVVFCDDLGYGDLGCQGHPTIRTPHLDRMAAEGMRFTQFYCAAPVCTPSRAAILTGRLPIRSGMCSDKRRVLFPDSGGGLPADEITLAEALKAQGYATACIGKWHLGHLPQFQPTKHGFDMHFGLPYSNDMDRVKGDFQGATGSLKPKVEWWKVPLLRDGKVVEQPADQRTLTKRYTEEAIRFIGANREQPFFLYLPHTMPHLPLFRSKDFEDKSVRGLYGDVIEEIDWSVGQILDTLRKSNLADNTLVIFTSDNGPWLPFGITGGSAGLLRDGKGSTWEGGMRVPGIAWWPGKVPAGKVSMELASTLDLLPTFVALAGGKSPADRLLDGHDISPALFGTGTSPRREMFFYRGEQLYALRSGDFKAHFVTRPAYGGGKPQQHDPPQLYNLQHDPSERHDIASQHPDVVAEIVRLAEAHKAGVVAVPSQLEIRLPKPAE